MSFDHVKIEISIEISKDAIHRFGDQLLRKELRRPIDEKSCSVIDP